VSVLEMLVRLLLVLSAAAALLAISAKSACAEAGWALYIDEGPEVGPPCITAADLASRIQARTGAPLAVLDEPLRARPVPEIAHWIEGRMLRSGDAATLALTLRDASDALIGERVLERPITQCEELRDAAVLAIAVMMGKGEALLTPQPAATEPPATEATEPAAAEPDTAEPPAEAPSEPAPPAPAQVERPASPPRATYRAPIHARLFAGATIAADIVPGVSAHAALTARVIHAIAWPIELSMHFLGQSEAELGGSSNGRATFTPLFAVLTTCPFGTGTGLMRVDACLGVLGGVSLTSATGFTQDNNRSAQPLAGIVLRLPISLRISGPLALRASATIGTPLTYFKTTAFDSERKEQVIAETSPLFGSLDVALGLDLF
jgi:hypothetical protein